MKTNLQTNTTNSIETNGSIRQFVKEIIPQLQWDLVPYRFLYDLYRSWYTTKNPNGAVYSSKTFHIEFRRLMRDNPDWDCTYHLKYRRPGNRMSKPEPMIEEYNLEGWMNPMYMDSKDTDKKCIPQLQECYTGMVRV